MPGGSDGRTPAGLTHEGMSTKVEKQSLLKRAYIIHDLSRRSPVQFEQRHVRMGRKNRAAFQSFLQFVQVVTAQLSERRRGSMRAGIRFADGVTHRAVLLGQRDTLRGLREGSVVGGKGCACGHDQTQKASQEWFQGIFLRDVSASAALIMRRGC